jgi:hypothetical protein
VKRKPYTFALKGCLGSSGQVVYLDLDQDEVVNHVHTLSKQPMVMLQRYYSTAPQAEYRCYCLREADAPSLIIISSTTLTASKQPNGHNFRVDVVHSGMLNQHLDDDDLMALDQVPGLCKSVMSQLRQANVVNSAVAPVLRIDCFLIVDKLVVNEIEWDWDCFFFSTHHDNTLCKDVRRYAFVDLLECIRPLLNKPAHALPIAA